MLRIIVIVVAALAVGHDADAKSSRLRGQDVTVTGCVVPGLEVCLSIGSLFGTRYDVSGVRPVPTKGKEVVLRGMTKSGVVGPCFSLPVLVNVTWAYTGGTCFSPSP